MVCTLTSWPNVNLFQASGAKQHYVLLESLEKKEQLLIQRLPDKSLIGCIQGTLPNDFQFQAYASKGGDVGVLEDSKGLLYFLLPGATVQGKDFKISYFGETIPPVQAKPLVEQKASSQKSTTQAMILGAGLGTRILPLTEAYLGIAKPALPWVGDSTVIGSLVELLSKQGIERIFVNTCYQRTSVQEALNQACAKHGMQWFEIPEERPTGTAGGVLHILNNPQDFPSFNPNEPLLVLQGDAVSNVDLADLINVHHRQNAMASVGCQIVSDEDVPKFGIIATDSPSTEKPSGFIRRFLEKPSLAEAGSFRLASTGFYVLSPALFPHLKAWYQERLEAEQAEARRQNETPSALVKEFDFAKDVFNMCLENSLALYAYEVAGFWCDIGNPAQYVETIAMAYRGELGQTLPENLKDYYDAQGVFYWNGCKPQADKAQLSLAGGVVVTQKS
jgi:NDP-sugar pyrophosphorylase family protein